MCPSSRDVEGIEAYWQEVEERIDAAEFGPIPRADEERCEADWTRMQGDDNPNARYHDGAPR